MTHVAFASLKSTIQSSLRSFLAIVLATVTLLSIPSSAPPASAETSFSQLGADIDGEAAGDYSGNDSIALSSDGSTVAIGAIRNDDGGSNAGHVRVYSYNGSNWIQVGSDIDGEAGDDNSGYSVSLSSDGSIVAIGAYRNDGNGSEAGHVRVYSYNGSNWIQVGSDIDGEAANDQSGRAVALSSDGSTVAIGAIGNDGGGGNAGHVRVYSYNGSNWIQVGSDIDGEAGNDYFGHSVSLSSDGSTVAIGAYRNDGGGSNAGHVRVYSYNGSNWIQDGSDIDGEAANDNSGYSVSLSSDGATVAIGAYLNDDGGSNAGHVRVYSYNGSNWIQDGSDIDGEAGDDYSGFSVSLSSDGSTVAIGAFGNDGGGSNAGHVRVYSYNGSNWIQDGSDIDGDTANIQAGRAVSLSGTGSRVAIAAPLVASTAGQVKVFSILEAALTPTFATPTQTSDGFTVQVSNYDDNYSWTASASSGSSVISGSGLITVTGLSAGASSTVTVGTTRSGYSSGSADVDSSAFTTLTPTFATPTKTSDGYTVQVSNYEASFTWSVSASSGSAAISGSGLITVTGLSAGASSTVTVGTTRTGYTAGSATVSSSALEAALTPTFATPTKTSDGFTVHVSNYDANYTWSASASAGSAAISGSGLITVTGLSAGASSTVTVGTTRTGYTAGSATVSGTAIADSSSSESASGEASSKPYFGPISRPLMKTPANQGEESIISGFRMDTVERVHSGDHQFKIVSNSPSELVVLVPTGIRGLIDLTLAWKNEGETGTYTVPQALDVAVEMETEDIQAKPIKKLTTGSFKGFIAIYTKGYEGSKLSAKVAGKWLLVDSLDESWRGNDYSRTVRFTGAGYDIFVHLYIDGEYIRTDELTTK